MEVKYIVSYYKINENFDLVEFVILKSSISKKEEEI